jgi:hypothetical protein
MASAIGGVYESYEVASSRCDCGQFLGRNHNLDSKS